MSNPCKDCTDMNCKICIHCGENTKMDVTDSYRQSVKSGYYSTTLIAIRDNDGNFIRYEYNKPGE